MGKMSWVDAPIEVLVAFEEGIKFGRTMQNRGSDPLWTEDEWRESLKQAVEMGAKMSATPADMKPTYMGDKHIVATIGDVVMAPGNLRGIIIAVKGTFVTVLTIGTKMETGVTSVLTPRYIHDFPANECSYLEKQTLSL